MTRSIAIAFALAIPLAACERSQSIDATNQVRKADTRAFQIQDNGYLASGWTPGNEASWDAQLKKRAQAQNDFAPVMK